MAFTFNYEQRFQIITLLADPANSLPTKITNISYHSIDIRVSKNTDHDFRIMDILKSTTR